MSLPLDRFRLEGQTVAITGASSGFGHHFAGVLSAAGARVVLGARRVEKIEERVREIRAAGGEALGMSLDVCSRDSLASFLDSAWEAFGGNINEANIVKDIGAQCGSEAKRVVELMNDMGEKWIPGKQRGRPVKVRYTLPVKFRLE